MSKNRCRNERLRQCRGNNEEGYGRAWPGTGVRAGNDCDLIVVIRPSTARPVNLHVGLAKVFPDAAVRLVNYLPSERRLPNNQLFLANPASSFLHSCKYTFVSPGLVFDRLFTAIGDVFASNFLELLHPHGSMQRLFSSSGCVTCFGKNN